MNTNNNNNDPPNDDDETHHADVPLLVWDGTKYQLDYNYNNHRPIYVWDGTTYTDIVYDDDDDDDDDATNYGYDAYDEYVLQIRYRL